MQASITSRHYSFHRNSVLCAMHGAVTCNMMCIHSTQCAHASPQINTSASIGANPQSSHASHWEDAHPGRSGIDAPRFNNTAAIVNRSPVLQPRQAGRRLCMQPVGSTAGITERATLQDSATFAASHPCAVTAAFHAMWPWTFGFGLLHRMLR